jgi:hypothetical protein
MDADQTSNPIARYETLVRAYEALSKKMAEHVNDSAASTGADVLEAERLQRELAAARREAWFQAYWAARP